HSAFSSFLSSFSSSSTYWVQRFEWPHFDIISFSHLPPPGQVTLEKIGNYKKQHLQFTILPKPDLTEHFRVQILPGIFMTSHEETRPHTIGELINESAMT